MPEKTVGAARMAAVTAAEKRISTAEAAHLFESRHYRDAADALKGGCRPTLDRELRVEDVEFVNEHCDGAYVSDICRDALSGDSLSAIQVKDWWTELKLLQAENAK